MKNALYHVCLVAHYFLYYTTASTPEQPAYGGILKSMNIYFSGLGGVGVGPLVEIARDAGYSVMGSDLADGLVTHELRQQGVVVNIGQDGAFLQSCHDDQPIDWFVYTAALPDNHPELLLAKQLGIHTAKRDELLAHIIEEKKLKLIAISGTHGKTTTTGMMVWALKQLGIPISYSVGTTISFGSSGQYDPDSEFFIYECDEYDRNFLHFTPHLSLLTSVDYDHPDTYPTEQEYIDAFAEFIGRSEHTILWKTDSDYLQNVPEHSWVLHDTMPLKLAGEHNRRNGTLVAKAIEYLQLSEQGQAVTAIEAFPGTDRRFERLADNLYSDYGHHPKEIAATLQMAREVSDNVVLVYQPHQNRRQHRIQKDYIDQFELAETVYWLPTYLSREDPMEHILQPNDLIQNITNKQVIQLAELNEELWHRIELARQEGKLVLCMGAGSIDGWLRAHLAR